MTHTGRGCPQGEGRGEERLEQSANSAEPGSLQREM